MALSAPPSAGVGVGDVVLGISVAHAATISPPAGWTALRAGTITNLSYWIGWIRLADGDDLTFSRSSTAWGMTVDAIELRHVCSVSATTVAESSAVTSVTLPAPAAVNEPRTLQLVMYSDGEIVNEQHAVNPSDGSTPGVALSTYGVTGTYSTWRNYGRRTARTCDLGAPNTVRVGTFMGAPILGDAYWGLHPGTYAVVNDSTMGLETIDEIATVLVTLS